MSIPLGLVLTFCRLGAEEGKFEAMMEDYAAKAQVVERLKAIVLRDVKLDAMSLQKAIAELQELGVKDANTTGVINVVIHGLADMPRPQDAPDEPFAEADREAGADKREAPKWPETVSLSEESISFARAVDVLCTQAGYRWAIEIDGRGQPILDLSPNPKGQQAAPSDGDKPSH